MVAMTLASALTYIGLKVYKHRRYLRMATEMLVSLDSDDDDVVDHLLVVDDDIAAPGNPANHPAINPADPLLGNEFAIVNYGAPLDPPPVEPEENPIEEVNPIGELDNNYSRPRNRNKYMKVLLQMVKGRFGTPTDSEANRLVIRRFLHDYMTKRRNRPSVISKTIPQVLELAFLPDKDEVDLRIVSSHPLILERKAYRLGGWWSWFLTATAAPGRPTF